jgi:hypothetical protein
VDSWLGFLTLAALGLGVLFAFSRLVLVPVAKRLQARYGIAQTTYTDLIVTVPLVLHIIWIIAVVAWITAD